MKSIPTDYRRVVLDCLGDCQLRKLSLEECTDVNPLVELLPIKRLQVLSIQYCDLTPSITSAATLMNRVPRAVLDDCTDQFLPELKELDARNNCLGYWSRLFECHRPSLAKCYVKCFHLGLASVSQFNWSDAPNMWPNLKELGCATFNTLKSIAPHLNEFQHPENIIVPNKIRISSEWVDFSTSNVLAKKDDHSPVFIVHRETNVDKFFIHCPYVKKEHE